MARNHHFCCCLPIRLGALLITGTSAFWTTVAAALCWYVLIAKHELLDSKRTEIALGVVGGGYTLGAFISILALWGVLAQKLKLIKTYVTCYAWYLGATYVYSIAFMVLVLKANHNDFVKACHTLANGDAVDSCTQNIGATKTSTAISIVISLLIQTYCLIIVYQYGQRLEDRHGATREMALGTGPKYAMAPVNEHNAEYAPKAYAYNAPQNSFGNTNHV